MGIKTTGADTFISFLQLTTGAAETVHHGHMPEITVTSPTTATGVRALQDLLIWLGTVRVIGFGHYHETYTVVDGQWRISSLKLRPEAPTRTPTPSPTTGALKA